MEQLKFIILPLIIGYLLDLILGDPRKLPHPIVGFGNTISFFTKLLNLGKSRLLKGSLMTLLLAGGVFFLFYFMEVFLMEISEIALISFTSIFVFYGLANKSLLQEGIEVFDHFKQQGIRSRKETPILDRWKRYLRVK